MKSSFSYWKYESSFIVECLLILIFAQIFHNWSESPKNIVRSCRKNGENWAVTDAFFLKSNRSEAVNASFIYQIQVKVFCIKTFLYQLILLQRWGCLVQICKWILQTEQIENYIGLWLFGVLFLEDLLSQYNICEKIFGSNFLPTCHIIVQVL